MYTRHQYLEPHKLDWKAVPNPYATKKYDGAHFWCEVQQDGSFKFYSRRPSVKGHFPERSDKLPHLTDKKLPQFAGHVFSVELIHTGHNKNNKESHPRVGGLLNSLPPKAIADQKEHGPIRAVLLDVLNPPFNTFEDKLVHMREFEKALGKPDLMFVPPGETTHKGINKLLEKTKTGKEEGVIITSLTKPESSNPRIKFKHYDTFNLRVNRVIQEFDIHGKPKESMGALELVDRTGRVVCFVGTGFDRETRIDAWKNPKKWIGSLVQVKTMGLGSVGGRLRMPVYNGPADGELDIIE